MKHVRQAVVLLGKLGGGGGVDYTYKVWCLYLCYFCFLSHYFESNNRFKLKTSCWLCQRYLLHIAVSCMIIHIEFEVFTFIISIFLSHYFESNNGFKLKTSCWLRQRYLLHMAVSNVCFKKQYRDSP